MKFGIFLLLSILASACAIDDYSAAFYENLKSQSLTDEPAVRILLTEAASASGAVCLDGSPPAYYFRAGNGTGANKFHIHHQGGGWCESHSACYGRSKTELGSSKDYPAHENLGGGYFSQDPAVNPMHNWNTVLIRYCDGGSFSGDNEDTVVINNTLLYYRGFRILQAVITDLLEKRGLRSATALLVAGSSAGGLATYLHADYWASRMPAGMKVKAMPDSGFFLDYSGPPQYREHLHWVYHAMNSTAGVNPKCLQGYPVADRWRCIFAEHTSPFTTTPIFALQSTYDSWQIKNDLGSSNPTDVNNYGADLARLVKANLLNQPQHGVFLDSCEHHVGQWNNIRIDGKLVSQAFTQWWETGVASHYFQNKPFPCPECCKP